MTQKLECLHLEAVCDAVSERGVGLTTLRVTCLSDTVLDQALGSCPQVVNGTVMDFSLKGHCVMF